MLQMNPLADDWWDVVPLDADPVHGRIWTLASLDCFQARPAPEACADAAGPDGKALEGLGEALHRRLALQARKESGRPCLVLRGAGLSPCRLALAVPLGNWSRHLLLLAARSLGRELGLAIPEGVALREGSRSASFPAIASTMASGSNGASRPVPEVVTPGKSPQGPFLSLLEVSKLEASA